MAHYVVGLTGGIGSGKTTVSTMFQSLGIDVVDADVISHQTTARGQPVLKSLAAHFGQQVMNQHGDLDRAWLRNKVFHDSAAKQWLESTLHPLIGNAIDTQIENSQTAYTLFVSPLLIHSQFHALCQSILVVHAGLDKQRQRTLSRDQCQAETVDAIIQQQVPPTDLLKLADHIIDNSQHQAALKDQVRTLHTQFLKDAKQYRTKNSEKHR